MRPGGAGIAVFGAALLAAACASPPAAAPPPVETSPSIETAAIPAAATAAPAASAPTAAAPAAAPEAAPPSAALSPEDRDALRAILERVPRDRVPTGTGSITGEVRTDDGKPLPGVEVAFWPEKPRSTPAVRAPITRFNQREPEETAVESFLSARWHRDATRNAITDAAGRYRVEGLSDEPHRAGALLPGWNLQPRPAADGHRAGAVVDFVATASVEVLVEISCADGPMPEQLQVRPTDPQSGGWSVRASGGSIRLKPGKYELFALGGVQETHRSDPQAVEIPQAAVGPTLRFELKARPGIRGRLIFPDGQDSEDARVIVQRLVEGARADPASVRSGGREFQGRNRREDRSFFFPDVAPGRYALGVARGSRGRVVVVEEVDVGTGLVEHDLRVPSPDPSEFISVSVLGPDGEPLKGVQISTGYKSKGSSSSGGSTVVRRPDGTLWVFHHEHQFSEDPEGTYWITLTAKNHGNVTLEYRKGERSEWTVRMEEPGRVEARVTGIEKSPVADRLSFQLLAPSADGRVFRDTRSERVDAAGLQVLSSVQPGEYALVLLVAHSHVSMPVARVPVTVRGGRNEFTVPLPPLHQVVVTGAEGTATLQTPEGVRFVIWSQSTDGRAVFEGIPEGEYTVNAGSKSKSFRVSGPTKVEL